MKTRPRTRCDKLHCGEAVYVLHCFHKTTQKTAKSDIDLAAARYKLIGA